MSFPRYVSYRDSGVEWRGEVPSHWTDVRLRHVAALNPSKGDVAELPDETELSFIPMEAVGEDGTLDLTRTRPVGEVRNGYSYFADGDVIFAKVTPCLENGKGALVSGLVGGRGFGTTELTVLRPRSLADGRFLRWLTAAHIFRGPAEGEMVGAGGLKRVPDDFVRDYAIAWPSASERREIACFLDRETAKIDALVEEQRRLIELLKEKRQAVISHAVNKGLDPNAPMKDSGVEWLGEVPAHWNLKRIKHVASHVVDCLHTTPTYDGGVEYPAVRTADLERGRLNLEEARLVSRDVYEERVQRLRPIAGDILYSREGERFGMAALVPMGVDLCLGQRMMMFRLAPPNNPGYIMWALNSESVYQQVLATVGGATSPHVNISDIVNFYVPAPPSAEQVEIASWIDHQVGRLDQLLAQALKANLLLAERRAALISAAVTGKIDVRGLASAAPDAEAA